MQAANAAANLEHRLEKGVHSVATAPRRVASAAWSAMHCTPGDEACEAAAGEDGAQPFRDTLARVKGPTRFWQACEGELGSGCNPSHVSDIFELEDRS